METLPAPQLKSSSNGSPRRRGEREGVLNKAQSIKLHPENNAALFLQPHVLSSYAAEKSRDSLVYLTTCMIGHLVEVHLKNGSVYSGIFHAADVDKDFGIVLKMASLIKDGTLRGHKSRSEFYRKPPSKTFIIPADELVQVVAENLSVSSDGMLNAVQSEKPVELLTDSSISKSRYVNQERELTPWEPDGNVPPDLDNVFDDTIGEWDQFEVNESLFGVKSTFDERQYTTILPQSTRTRELEEKAQRIAKEVEDEITRDVHVAEERGLQLNEKSDIDEETKYSAVRRVDEFDDSGFNEEDDKLLDTCNYQTFGGSSTSSSGQKPASSSGKGYENVPGDSQPSRNNTNVNQSCSISGDDARHLLSEQRSQDFPAPGRSISETQLELGERRKNNSPELPFLSTQSAGESVSGHGDIKEDAKIGGGGTSKIFEAAMDTLPDPQSKSSSNVSPHGREKSRDSLEYLATCMIDHLVEVHLKNGSVYSGIFYAADVEKDFGIILNKASLIKDSTLRGHKSRSEFFRKPPLKTFIIPADELVKIVDGDLSVSSDGMLNAVQKLVELLKDSSISKPASSSGQKPASSSGQGYEDVPGGSQSKLNNTNVDQSCSISGDDARHLPSEQRSRDYPAPSSIISESQIELGERGKDNNPEVSHISRSTEESVSGNGDIKEGAKFGGGGTPAWKTVAERERQGSQVSGKTKCESSFGQSDSRSSESFPASSTPSLPVLPPSSSIGSLSSSEKSTLNPDAKFKQFEAAMETLPAPQSKSSSNGSPRRREKSRDSLEYLTTCMIDHLVEVHLENGSVYSGIFHAADVEKDFGIVLKKASLIKDSTLRGHKSRSEFFRKPPLKTFIIPADELVKVVAGDLSVSSDGTLYAVQSEKSVELLTDSSTSKSASSSAQKPASSSDKGYEDVPGDSQSELNNTNVDQSCSIYGNDARHLPSEQRSKHYPAPGSSISESQLGEHIKKNNPEVSLSSRSAEELVSGHGGNQVTDVKEGAKFSGGGTSASKTVYERERRVSRVSGKTISESSFGQSDSKSAKSLPASWTPSRPGLPPSSSIGSLSSSKKFTLNRDAKFKQFEAAMETLPSPQSKYSSNGSPRRREKSRDSLEYLTTRMIDHLVEVHLKNGSVYSGIFHAANVEKDFGIVLKKASLIKDSTLRGHKSRSEFVKKPPSKTFIIPADELVKVVAEDLSLSIDGTLYAVQSEKPVELLTDSSISKSASSSGQNPASSSGKGYGDVPGDSQPELNSTNLDQSCSISGDDARHLPSEQRSKDYPAPGSSISESQLSEHRKNNNPEVSHSTRSAEESVSGHGGNQVTDIKEGAKFCGGGTSSKTVAEREKQVSRVSGKTISESSFGQPDSRSAESLPASLTPSRPGLPPSSSIGSSSSSKKFTLNPDAKEFKPSQPPMENTSFYCPAAPVQQQAQTSMENTSFYCPAAPVQQMPVQAQTLMENTSFYCPAAPVQQQAQTLMENTSFYYPAAPVQQMPVQAQTPMENTSFYCPAAPVQQMPVQTQTPMENTSFYCPAPPVQQMPMQAQTLMENTSFYCPAAPVQQQAQTPMENTSFYCPTPPIQQMPGDYGIQPQYFVQQQMFYYQYHGQQYGQTGYPQYVQAQYPQQQQMMMGQPPRPPPPYHQPDNPYNEGRE